MIAEADILRLEHRLQHALAELHPNPARIHADEELCRILVDLYDSDDVDAVWSLLEPYLRKHRAGLRNVWREHEHDPCFALLDCSEALIVFERAEHAGERLRRSWPGPRSWLVRVSDVWGVPI